MGRTVHLVLVRADGALIGLLPPLELDCPHWPEAADVQQAAAAHFGVQLVVLRLLSAERPRPPGGHVTCLAELDATAAERTLPTTPVPADHALRATSSHPKRMPWAELGGPGESLAWARAMLGPGTCSFRAVQQRTWNLSTLFRLEPSHGTGETIWLKQVPHFFRHESTILGWLNTAAPGAAPALLATDGRGRSLLAHVPGDDLYEAPAPLRQRIDQQLHVVQLASIPAVDELVALGVPDRRGAKLAAYIREKLSLASLVDPGIESLLRVLDARLVLLRACNLPDTLVHGDNHPGNARGTQHSVALLDWGDAFIGNPALDLFGLVSGLPEHEAAPLISDWCARWKRRVPGSHPENALALVPFIQALARAALFAHFLQEIEESEWPYHRDDVPECLKLAKELVEPASS
jgi:hypothetical protein